MTFAFEKLLVYQKSVDFADDVCSATEQFHRGYGFLVDQLNRAALSISSNIAECHGRFTKAVRHNGYSSLIALDQITLFPTSCDRYRTPARSWSKSWGPLHLTCVYSLLSIPNSAQLKNMTVFLGCSQYE
jgi:hypothetical protein